jgi:outer membrane lipoprotein-sorting protein
MLQAKKSGRGWHRICWPLLAIILAITLAIPGWTLAAEFSAQMITRGAHTEGTQGKIYVKGDKIRQEFGGGEEAHISILRPDKQVVWMVMPGQKMYMEMPLTAQATGKMMQMPQDEAQTKLLGTETVNGYAADKYETVTKNNGKSAKHYVWVAKKLGLPIKMTGPDHSFSMEYQNIKEGEVPDSLFEIPAGCQKMTMPTGMPLR